MFKSSPSNPFRSSGWRSAYRRLLGAFAIALSATAFAAEPELKHLFPAAGQQGTHVAVSIEGKAEPWPVAVWCDAPGITFRPTPVTGVFDVEIAPDATPGAHLVRLWNAEGASAPCAFIVSREPELRSIEPNDEVSSAQPIGTMPATFSGRLDKVGDVDCFAVTLKQGQSVVAWVESYVLGSTCDALLQIANAEGRVLAFNHDGRNLDPLLAWQAPQDGTFIIQLMGFAHPPTSSVQLAGGKGCIYRLHVSTGPVVRFTQPLAIQAGAKSTLRLAGWSLGETEIAIDATHLSAESTLPELPLASSRSLQPIPISAVSEKVEPEGDANVVHPIEVPSAVTGRIGAAGEEDRYTITATKGRSYELKLTAARVGSSLDAWLKIQSLDGKEIAKNDDAAGSRDPLLIWSAPSDGPFTIAIGDVTHCGGPDFVYRLQVTEAAPAVSGLTTSHSVTVQPGKPAELKAVVKRTNGFKAKLQLAAKKLPAGVSAAAVDVPEKDGEVVLKLTAEPAAAPAGQPFALVLTETESGREHPVRYSLVATSEDNGVPQGYSELAVEATDQLWLTVSAEAAK